MLTEFAGPGYQVHRRYDILATCNQEICLQYVKEFVAVSMDLVDVAHDE